LLVQHNISIEDPLMVDMSEDLDKKSCSWDDNSLFISLIINRDDSSDEEIITNLSNLIIELANSNKKDFIILF
jgi:hypothetical protein